MDKQRCACLMIPAIYAVVLAVSTIIGVPFVLCMDENYYAFDYGGDHAIQMPIAAAVIAVSVGASGVGLLLQKNWGRYLFLLTAPWGSLALGSVFPSVLWGDDIPQSALLIIAYVACAFMLSRESSTACVGICNATWRSRGAMFIAVLAIMLLCARLLLAFWHPTGGGGVAGYIHAAGRYVEGRVLCEVPLANYVIALVAASLPVRKKGA